jgi:hypothetical protein
VNGLSILSRRQISSGQGEQLQSVCGVFHLQASRFALLSLGSIFRERVRFSLRVGFVEPVHRFIGDIGSTAPEEPARDGDV